MAKSKTVRIGTIWTNDIETAEGKKAVPSIRLGSKNKNADYDVTVELVVKNNKGEIIATQTDGFVSLYTPNDKAPSKLKYELVIPRNG